mgnify:CR=1 FL=1
MNTTISFFPVGNGDMTLLMLSSGRTILMDAKISADSGDRLDLSSELRDRLFEDESGRKFVDVLLLSHPDEDHCLGMAREFHLGMPESLSKDDDKIFVREIWSSPMVFRRASTQLTFCEDAKAFNTEARRRVKHYQAGKVFNDGNRILILGKDEEGKTDNLGEILVEAGTEIKKINGDDESTASFRLLSPTGKSEDDEEEKKKAKNLSSVILQCVFHTASAEAACCFLTGGDAEVVIWEKMWELYGSTDWLKYDILQAPHHCSWRSLTHDSWSDLGEDARISKDARSALSQTYEGAIIISSSKPVKDDEDNPPCIRAKREYETIGEFICLGDSSDEVLEFEVTSQGPRKKTRKIATGKLYGGAGIGVSPQPHG